jgi:hypothetical protein
MMEENQHEVNVEEIDDDELAEQWDMADDLARRYAKVAGVINLELIRRMEAKGATMFDTEHWKAPLESGGWIVDDPARLRQRLGPLISLDQIMAVFPPPKPRPPQPDQRRLNELIKLGGDIAAIIAEERHRGEPRLNLKRKEAKG